MNIFEALRESHENQRNLSEQLVQTHGLTEERKELFDALRNFGICGVRYIGLNSNGVSNTKCAGSGSQNQKSEFGFL